MTAATSTTQTQRSFATSPRLRSFSLMMLYAAQGAPEGLLYVAAPAWLAANGATAADIGTYIAIILLPWSFKLINGVFMDRVSFLPMGRRRPWVIVGQLGLALTLIAFAIGAPVGADLWYLTVAGFLANFAATFQDVAIDGMAIDVVPEHERARANGFMWGGKVLGIAGGSAATSWLIANYGFAAASLATAAFVLLVMLAPLLLRERPGEKLLPWSDGAASPQSLNLQATRWLVIVKNLWRAMATPSSLLLAVGIFIALSGYGLDTAYGPVFAVQLLGFSEENYGNLAGLANVAGGVFGIALCGVIADKLGPRRALSLALLGMALCQIAMGFSEDQWAMPGVFEAYTYAYVLLFVLMSVSLYAEAMAMSSPVVAATQFSIFMAILNLGTSFGARLFGPIKESFDYAGVFIGAGLFALAAAALFRLPARAIAAPKEKPE